MSTEINNTRGRERNIGTKIVYNCVDMGQGKSRQLSVPLLEYISKIRRTAPEQKQVQRLSEFVDSGNILPPYLTLIVQPLPFSDYSRI